MTATKETEQCSVKDVSATADAAPADFETAIAAAGFGTFNILLLLAALPAAMATVFETSTMAYILPSAECDLQLTLLDKGILNGITYAGMITSAVTWGYVADTKGRKKLLVYGYLFDVISVLGGALSQNRIQLMVCKYIGGFIMCGPFAVLMSYLTELHSKKYRARVMMCIGIMFSVATLSLPIMALSVLPRNWDWQLAGLKFTAWQIFLAISAIPSALAGIFLALFPESPKFLMTQKRNAEALLIFQKIYALNKRVPRETFPIKELAVEVRDTDTSRHEVSVATIESVKTQQMEAETEPAPAPAPSTTKKPTMSLREGLQQLRPLFTKPYLGLSIQVYLMNFAVLLGQNTMRLWLPQLFASIEEYERNIDSGVTSMCSILEYSVNKTNSVIEQSSTGAAEACVAITTVASYTNNIVVALTSFLGYILAGVVVNRIGSNRIITIGLAIAGTSAALMYWSSSALTTLIIASLFVSFGSVSSMSLISSSVTLFPTSLRTMIVSIAMMLGRTGSIMGNVLFPALMELGCIPPFIMISFVMYFAGIMSAFLPSTKKTVLK